MTYNGGVLSINYMTLEIVQHHVQSQKWISQKGNHTAALNHLFFGQKAIIIHFTYNVAKKCIIDKHNQWFKFVTPSLTWSVFTFMSENHFFNDSGIGWEKNTDTSSHWLWRRLCNAYFVLRVVLQDMFYIIKWRRNHYKQIDDRLKVTYMLERYHITIKVSYIKRQHVLLNRTPDRW